MEFIILLLIIYTNSILLSNFLKKKIEQVIPITVIGMTLIVYIAGLFQHLNFGVKIVEFISILSTLYNVVYFIRLAKMKKIKSTIKRIFTPGMLVYTVLFLIFPIMNKDRIFEDYDEFNHWALIIKNMYLYNGYGNVENSIITFNEYPPFTACFQYIVLNIKGIYSEDLIIIAQNILYLSMIIPICYRINHKKNLTNLFIIIPIILVLPLVFYEDFFVNILVDGFLGILFSIGLFVIYKNDLNKKYKYTLFSLILTSLALTKTVGILFALILFIFEFIICIKNKREIKLLFISIFLPVLLTYSWYMCTYSVEKEWDYDKVWNEEVASYKDNLPNFYLKAFFTKEEITSRKYSLAVSILILCIYSIYVYERKKNEKHKRMYIYIMIVTVFSLIIFLIGLLWMYTTIFIMEEALGLASYARYNSTILLAWSFVNSFIFCDSKKINISRIYICIALLISLAPLKTINEKYIQNQQYIKCSHIERDYYTKIKKYKYKFSNDDKVFLLSDAKIDNICLLKLYRYELMGVTRITNENPEYIVSEDLFKNELIKENYTHLYIYKISNELALRYKNIFDGVSIEKNTLYKIEVNENENLKLQKVTL